MVRYITTSLACAQTETALIYDAVSVLARAIDNLNKVKPIEFRPLSCDRSHKWDFGNSIINYIKMVHFDGLTGLIQFDSRGQRSNFSLDIIELKSTGFVKVWTPEYGLQVTQQYDVTVDEALASLRSSVVRVTTIEIKPFYMKTDNNTYVGFNADLVKHLAERLQFNYTINLVGDGEYGSFNPATQEWNGMVRELIDKKADIVVGDLTINFERGSVVDFSYPYMTLGIGILMKKPTNPEKSMFSFLAPFSGEVWMYLATAFLGVSLVVFTLGRFTPYEWVEPQPSDPDDPVLENNFNINNSFWFSTGSLMQQGSSVVPKAVSTRLLASVWGFFTLIIGSSYTASLAAVLTSSRMQSPITNVEGLAKQRKIPYGCVDKMSTYRFFQDSNFTTYKQMWDVMSNADPSVFVKNNAAGLERVRRGNYAFLMESTLIDYHTARDCELDRIGDLLNSRFYGVATPQGSPYRTLFSKAIRELEESETLDLLREKWWKTDIKCEVEQTTSELNLTAVGGVFIILVMGLVLSLPIAMAEFCWRTKKVPRDKRVSVDRERKFCHIVCVQGSLISELWKEFRLIMSFAGEQRPMPPDDYLVSSSTPL
ncbi:hypothetical protein LAZ67_20002720 [Cordylochernes scorpioides]|uniref:Uncharacterized protein n=1 Tax=Cordylochernes scorpioides TaxID=51811 RepID=A0ABY6LMM8_9ARAC|nr:hypothetical protein LAZ67_20002720 [Cordylochernes scorpioides]